MTENVNLTLDVTKESMESTLEHLEKALSKIRAGRASAAMLQDVYIDYYGSKSPITQVANINNLDARTLTIQPWDKNMLAMIEKAIFGANLGVTPQNDGELIRITIPPLTEERRRDLVKRSKTVGEDAKVSIRTARQSANNELKQMVKDGLSEDEGKTAEKKIQDLTNNFATNIDKLLAAKEKEIMSI